MHATLRTLRKNAYKRPRIVLRETFSLSRSCHLEPTSAKALENLARDLNVSKSWYLANAVIRALIEDGYLNKRSLSLLDPPPQEAAPRPEAGLRQSLKLLLA
jgi:hypothetical protein